MTLSVSTFAVHAPPASPASGASPWVHLIPSGTFSGLDGRGPYRLQNPRAVIEASLGSGKIPIDENHATDLAAPQGSASPARGWIVAMDSRDDGIWGEVNWTPSGHALLNEKAYRWLSPVFNHEKDGTIVKVLRAALTNTPNLPQLTALHRYGGAGQAEPAALLTATDLDVCYRMGVDPAQFAATKVALMAVDQGRKSARMEEDTEMGAEDLTKDDLEICRRMGLDPAKYAENKRKMLARQAEFMGDGTPTRQPTAAEREIRA